MNETDYEYAPKGTTAQRDALLKFKQWVHAYLDNVGVPHDPDPVHTAEHGCRISGRMNYLKGQRDDLLAVMEEAATFWGRYAILNEMAQDELSDQKNVMEGKMAAAIAKAKGDRP
jgi:hypothetical protein